MVTSVVWLAVGIFSGIRSFSRQVEGFQRVPVPGQAELRFHEPGGYTVYFEGLGAADQQVAIPSLSVSLAPVGGGEEVPVSPYGGSATYSVGGRSGRAVGTFRPVIGRALRLTIPATPVLFFGGAALAVVVVP